MTSLIILSSTALPLIVGFIATHLYVAVSSICAFEIVSFRIATYGDVDGIGCIVCLPRRFSVYKWIDEVRQNNNQEFDHHKHLHDIFYSVKFHMTQ